MKWANFQQQATLLLLCVFFFYVIRKLAVFRSRFFSSEEKPSCIIFLDSQRGTVSIFLESESWMSSLCLKFSFNFLARWSNWRQPKSHARQKNDINFLNQNPLKLFHVSFDLENRFCNRLKNCNVVVLLILNRSQLEQLSWVHTPEARDNNFKARIFGKHLIFSRF